MLRFLRHVEQRTLTEVDGVADGVVINVGNDVSSLAKGKGHYALNLVFTLQG